MYCKQCGQIHDTRECLPLKTIKRGADKIVKETWGEKPYKPFKQIVAELEERQRVTASVTSKPVTDTVTHCPGCRCFVKKYKSNAEKQKAYRQRKGK